MAIWQLSLIVPKAHSLYTNFEKESFLKESLCFELNVCINMQENGIKLINSEVKVGGYIKTNLAYHEGCSQLFRRWTLLG